ncbi:MAG: type III-B CRISPR module-associated protein Cmr5 [Myxococcales bacterium]|nr:type III-B CRISPR module-associated protein Cmr5 [Myxococcales bacterium]
MTANNPPRGGVVNDERAQWAWEKVGEAYRQDVKVQKRYSSLVRRLPSMLQTSGLGQTMAFLFSQSKFGESNVGDQAEGSRLLYRHLAERFGVVGDNDGRGRAMDKITNMSPQDYRLESRKLQAVAEWLKRFGEGRLQTEE